MKKLLMLAAVIAFALPLRTQGADTRSADEAAIRKLYASYDATWEKGDAKAMAMFWAEDADHVEPDGRTVKGRAAIEKELADRFATDLKGTHSTETVEAVRFLKPDVAVVDAAYKVTGMRDAEGKILPPLQGRYVDIWLKHGGTWRIAADRPIAPASAAK